MQHAVLRWVVFVGVAAAGCGDPAPVADAGSAADTPAVAQDAVAQDAVAQDVVAQDVVAQDAVAQDVVAQDVVAQDVVAQDVVAQDAVVQDVVAQDVVAVPSDGGAAGEPITMEVPEDIAVGGGYLYFTRSTLVRRIALTGGAPTTVYTATGSGPTGIDADATGFAWTERFASTVAGAVRSCPHEGCPAMPTRYSGAESSNRVAVSATRVAWTSASASTIVVRRRDTASGGWSYRAAMPMQYTPTDIALDGDEVYWTTGGISIPGGGGGTPGMVLRCSAAAMSCAPTMLAAGEMIGHPHRIALGPGAVFFVSDTGLFRVGRDGAGLTRLAPVTTGTGANTFDLATDGTTVYWAIGGSLFRCAAASCTPQVLASLGPGFTNGLALDAASVFWGQMSLSRVGGILRFAR